MSLSIANIRRTFVPDHRTRKHRAARRGLGATAVVALIAIAAAPGHTEPKEVMDATGPLAEGKAPKSLEIAAGSGNVSTQTGSFNYSFPIAVPPGRNKMAPSLALSYSSDAAMTGSPVGAGWSLGIPSIDADWSNGPPDLAQGAAQAPTRWTSALAGGRELIETTEPAPWGYMSFRAQSDTSYARYQFTDSQFITDLDWRVLLPDGSKMHFGESEYMGGLGENEADWFPLTRHVDAFGNEVRYHWRKVEIETDIPDEADMGVHRVWLLDLIEYSINDGATPTMESHAEVRFEYDEQYEPCIHAALTVGASQSVRSGAARVRGYYPLTKIKTFVRQAGRGSAWRDATHYELRYSATDESCTDPALVPMRLLETISTTGFTALGASTAAPDVTFTYAGQPTSSVWKDVTGEDDLLPRGDRKSVPYFNNSTSTTMLLDIDGDALADHAESVTVSTSEGTKCGLSWRKNLGRDASGLLSFGTAQTIELPTMKWENFIGSNLGSPGSNEFCSLSGQFSMVIDLDPGFSVPSDYPGFLLQYSYRDMTRDGILDVATGLSGVGYYLDPDWFDYKPSTSTCPTKIPTTMQSNNGGGTPWPGVEPDPLDPNPTWDEPDVGEPLVRGPIGYQRCYRWNIYQNQSAGSGNRDFVLTQSLTAPIPMNSSAEDPDLTPGSNVMLSRHQAIDINGDGWVDFVEVENDGGVFWYVYLFDGTDIATGENWPFEEGYLAAYPGGTYSDDTGGLTYETTSYGMLLDVNSDGLPDLVKQFDASDWTVYYNNGQSFLEGFEVAVADLEPMPKSASRSEIVRAVAGADEGTRTLTRRLADRYGLGAGFHDYDTSTLHVNLGNGAFVHRTANVNRQITTVNLTDWLVTDDFIDVTGDGVADYIDDPETVGQPVRIAPLDLDGGAPRGKLLSINNGRGLTTAVTYEQANDSDRVTIGDAELPNPKWVVTDVESSYASGAPTSKVQYSYDTPVRTADDDGRLSFRGFDKVFTTAPSGSVVESRYDYVDDFSGRVKSTLTYKESETDPTSIADQGYEKHFLTVGGSSPIYVFVGRSDEYQCEYMNLGNTAVRSELDCRSQVLPRAKRSRMTPVGTGFALRVEDALDGELVTPSSIDGFHVWSVRSQFLYTASDYIIVDDELHKFRGTATETGGEWFHGGTLSGVTRHFFDSSLRFIEKSCVARDANDAAVITEGQCTAFAYDAGTGQVTHTQRPHQYFEDVIENSLPPLTNNVQEVRYENIVDADPFGDFKLFPLVTINELGHEVVKTFDLATGVELTVRGPNPEEKSKVTVDGFGRVLKREVNVGYSQDDYRLTHDNVYGDLTLPQTVTQKIARWLPTSPSYTNDTWTEIRTDYDGAGRPIVETEWDIGADEEAAITSYTYDAAGRAVTISVPDPSAQTGLGTVGYGKQFDSLGRVTCTTLPNGSGTVTTYGGLTVSVREFAGGGTCASPTSPATEPVAMKVVTSDVLGRIEKVEEVLDIVNTSDVATTEYGYDENNNVATVTRWVNANATPEQDIITTMVHDWVGNRLSIDRHDRTWVYTYDRNGKKRTELQPRPAAGVEMDYRSSWLYDPLDRVTDYYPAVAGLSSPDQTAFNHGAVTYEYDNGAAYDRTIGRLAFQKEPNNLRVSTYKYDSQGHTREVVTDVNLNPIGVPFTDTYTEGFPLYTVAGKPLYIDHPSGIRTIATFRRRGDLPYTLRTVRPNSSHLIEDFFTIVRNAAGAPRYMYHQYHHDSGAGYQIETGRTINYAYDSSGRLVSAASNDAAATAISQTYTYTGTSEVDSVVSTVGTLLSPRTFSFGYDDRHQLKTAFDTQGFTADYTFTRQGQLATADVVAPAAPGAVTYPRNVDYEYHDPEATSGYTDPELITRLANTDGSDYAVYTYDEAGSMTSRYMAATSATTSFKYDGAQRLRRRTGPGGDEVDSFYSGPNRWLTAHHGASSIDKLRIWIGASEFRYDCTSSACSETETRTSIAMGGRTVARIEQDPADQRTTKILQTNGLGHLLGVLSPTNNGSGTLSYTLDVGFQYGPFGEILEAGVASGADASDYLQRFNSKEYDVESGLSYYGYRYLDPVSLTWNRSDPLFRFEPERGAANPRRANLYGFVRNNPIRLVDPDGREDVASPQHHTVILYGRDTRTQESKTMRSTPKVYARKLGKAVRKAVGGKGKSRVGRFTSAASVKAAAGSGAKRIVIVSHAAVNPGSSAFLPHQDNRPSTPVGGPPVSGASVGAAVKGSQVEEVVILGCNAAETKLAKDVSVAAPGVRVVAFGGDVGLTGRPWKSTGKLAELTISTQGRKEFYEPTVDEKAATFKSELEGHVFGDNPLF